VIDAVTRLLPGVMGNTASGDDESFVAARLEYPQYTRPAEFRGHRVPDVLLSGDHARIDRWRRAAALRRTIARRPDLVAALPLTPEEEALLREFPDDVSGR
jgi:tRNA (guanine37-N1)-methyltransferase